MRTNKLQGLVVFFSFKVDLFCGIVVEESPIDFSESFSLKGQIRPLMLSDPLWLGEVNHW